MLPWHPKWNSRDSIIMNPLKLIIKHKNIDAKQMTPCFGIKELCTKCYLNPLECNHKGYGH